MTPDYPGRIPSNVGKEAKYSIVHGSAGMEVRLIYRTDSTEKFLLTTAKHPELVEMVNAVKGERQGGVFYVNEYQHVLVPAGGTCRYAGSYTRMLEFDLNGQVIGPKPPAGLKPGDEWKGPHVGIRYVIPADGSDVRYEVKTVISPTAKKEESHLLSESVGSASASRLAARLGKHKGQGGGRIYINEAREFFAPIGEAPQYIYLGKLGDDPWYPAPTVAVG